MPNHIKQAQPSPPLSHYTKFSPKTPTSHTHSHTHTHNQPNAQPKQDQTSLTSHSQLSLVGARRKNFVTHSLLRTQNPKPHPILNQPSLSHLQSPLTPPLTHSHTTDTHPNTTNHSLHPTLSQLSLGARRTSFVAHSLSSNVIQPKSPSPLLLIISPTHTQPP